MPEVIHDKQVFSLLEVTNSIKKTIESRYKKSYWIKTEMNKLNFYPKSGHCYPELVEKVDGKIIAEINAKLWGPEYQRINKNFIEILKEPLKDGIKILINAKIKYTPTHGLALDILDIDPSYTIGDLEKEKQDTIKKLKSEGVFGKNKLTKLATVPQRIAIISVETSKGYSDFINVLNKNAWGYKFFHLIFPALLQGDKAVEGIVGQLNRIRKVIHHFDAVAIIRGGGGDIGLTCYNHYNLSKAIALFPIPVLTGIGHSTNETVSEMVSHTNAITPTKLAEFLIQKFHNFSVPVKDAEKLLIDKSRRLILEVKTKLQAEVKLFRSVTGNILLRNRNNVNGLSQTLVQQSRFVFKNEKEYLFTIKEAIKKGASMQFSTWKQDIVFIATTIRKDVNAQIRQFLIGIQQNTYQVKKGSQRIIIANKRDSDLLSQKLSERVGIHLQNSKNELTSLEKHIEIMSPQHVLKRGYSITMYDGKAIKNTENLIQGDILKTFLYEGNIESIVTNKEKPTEP